MAQSLAGAATPPVTQSQDIVTPGGTLPVTLPPGPNDEQQRMATVMQGATSGDPIIQQLAAAIMGQQSKRQDIAQEFQGRKDLASYEAQLKEPLTTAQMNELNAQADKLRRPEEYTLNPGDVRFQGTNPVASVAPKPVVPPRPQTVTLNDGIFLLNPDGSKGPKIGDRPTADKQETSEADLVNLAALALKDPEQLKLMDKKTAEKVLARIQGSGQTLPNAKKDMQNDMVDKALETLNTVEAHPGLSGAVGAKGPSSVFGLKEEPIAGTAAAGFV